MHHDHDDDWRDRFAPPTNEVPVPVALQVPLVRTDDLAVVAAGFLVHSTGVRLTLRYWCRTDEVALHQLVHGHEPWADGAPMLGVELSDGRWASTLEDHRYPGNDPEVPALSQRGGNGGDRDADVDFWLTPVPPAGSLAVIFACGALGVEETSVTVDATPLAEAAARVETLWPVSPRTAEPYVPPEPPSLPEGSWFGDRLARRLADWEAGRH